MHKIKIFLNKRRQSEAARDREVCEGGEGLKIKRKERAGRVAPFIALFTFMLIF